jgi:DNA-directed RNA polymerase subunit RPC12/RpoP
MPGPEDWFDREVAGFEPTYSVEDFPGYDLEVLECLTCGAEVCGIRKTPPEEMACPRCGTTGMKILRVIRKIYLQ